MVKPVTRASWFYADRATGRDCNHRRAHRVTSTSSAGGGEGDASNARTTWKLGLAIANYESANNTIPIGDVFNTSTPPCKSPGFGNNCQNTPWFVMVLPFIEQGAMYNSFNAAIGTEGPGLGLGREQHGLHHPDHFTAVPER